MRPDHFIAGKANFLCIQQQDISLLARHISESFITKPINFVYLESEIRFDFIQTAKCVICRAQTRDLARFNLGL